MSAGTVNLLPGRVRAQNPFWAALARIFTIDRGLKTACRAAEALKTAALESAHDAARVALTVL